MREKMITRLEKLREQEKKIEKQLLKLPEGELRYHNYKGKCRYYIKMSEDPMFSLKADSKSNSKPDPKSDSKSDSKSNPKPNPKQNPKQNPKSNLKSNPRSDKNSGRKYINKKNMALAKGLAQKEFLTMQLRDIQDEIGGIESYLKHYDGRSRAQEYCCRDEAHRNLLKEVFSPKEEIIRAWVNATYESSAGYRENLIVKAPHGMVRSKSEAMISWALFNHNVPYRYECDMDLNGRTITPDFTLLHPRTGKIFVWEHFGLMDDPDYVSNYLLKSRQYIQCGYLPTDNLIMTFETKETPLDIGYVEALVKYYFG